MNSHEAGEGWLQIGDNMAGIMPAAADAGAELAGVEVATAPASDVDVSQAHQFFASTNGADLGQFPTVSLDHGAAATLGGDAAMNMPTGGENLALGNGSQMFSGLIDMASTFPGGGMLAAVLQFLQMLFSPQNLAGMLDPSALYAQAASAAEALLKKGVGAAT